LVVVLIVVAFARSAAAATLQCQVDVERLCEAGQICRHQAPLKPLMFWIINNRIELFERSETTWTSLQYRTIRFRRGQKITRWVNVQDGSRLELREAPGRARVPFSITSNDRDVPIRRSGLCKKMRIGQAI
jgi:hypothetical protein